MVTEKVVACDADENAVEALQRRIDDMGFGPAQIMAVCCCGGIMASEGSEVNIMGSITSLLEVEWNLTGFMKGFMTSVVFVGFAIGNFLSGSIGDRFGRRPAILLSYLAIFISGTLTSFTENAATMVCVRLFVGLGCGIGFPSVYSLVPEVSPMHLRGVKSAVMIGFMPLGEFYASLGVFLFDAELQGTTPLGVASWRTLVQWSCIPPLFLLIFSSAFLQESPHFLLSTGRLKELNSTLEQMAWLNNVEHVPMSFDGHVLDDTSQKTVQLDQEVFSWLESVFQLFSPNYVKTTLFLFLAHFTKDFAVFGLNYVFPQYFQETAGKLSVGAEMMTIAVLAVPGVVIASILMRTNVFGHITTISLTALLCSLASFGLLDFLRISACAYLVKFFAMAYFIVVVVYTAEVFPTAIRNSAVGLCAGAGRMGSILSPLLFELLLQASGSYGPWWFSLMALMLVVALAAPLCLELETKDVPLAGAHTEENAPLARSISFQRGTSYSSA